MLIDIFQFIDRVIDRLFDVANLFIGFASGILISTITFWLSYRHSIRNKLTKEFTVRLITDYSKVHENFETLERIVEQIKFKYYISCTSPSDCHINFVYLKLPKGVKGNSLSNAALAEIIFSESKYYVVEKPNFKGYLDSQFEIPSSITNQLQSRKRGFDIRLVVDTNKYGQVCSKKVSLRIAFGKYFWWEKIAMKFKSRL